MRRMSYYIDRNALIRKLETEMDWQDTYLPIHFKEWVIDETPAISTDEMQLVQWIPVSKCLPSHSETVLCVTTCGDIEFGIRKNDRITTGIASETVSHWMYLPNLPEEEGENDD